MRRYARVILGYTLLGLLLTWPMIAHFATRVPGDGIDDPSLAWNLWWVKHALVDQPQNPFACTWQFWPIGINLAFYTLTVLNGMLSVPIQALFGIVPAYNALLLSSFVLSGLGGFLLAREFLRRSFSRRTAYLAAFIAGALYAFASVKLFYAALGQGNIASSQWAPFAALYIWRAARRGGRIRDALLAGLFLVLQAYAELTYASFLIVFAGVAAVWGLLPSLRGRLGRPRQVKAYTLLIGRFTVIAAVFAIGIAPILANMLPDLRTEGDFFTSGGGFADVFSADLAGYAVPTQLHPLLGGIVRTWSHNSVPQNDGRYFAVDKGQQVYIGYVAFVLALTGAWRGRRRRDTWLWCAAAALFFLLTLGPNLRIAGIDTGIPLPFRIMERLPFFKGNRYPSRYSVMLLLSLAPLVSAGAISLIRALGEKRSDGRDSAVSLTASKEARRRQASLAGVLLALMLFEHLSIPLPSFDLQVPALYRRVAAEPGDFALLELPLGWRNGARVAGKQDVLIMQQLWYQTVHGKRVLGGNTSRNPEYKFQYFSEQATLARLIALTNAADTPQHDALRTLLDQSPITEDERAEALRWAAFTNIRYVMVHRDKLPPATETTAKELLPLVLVAEDGPLALYRVALPDDGEIAADLASYRLGSDADRMILGEGWSPVAPGSNGMDAGGNALGLFAQRPEVRLMLPFGTGAGSLRLRAGALVPEQRVTVLVDGRQVGAQPLSMSPSWLDFRVPADAGRGPLSDVRLRFDSTIRIEDLAERLSRPGPGGLLVRSAGQEAGDFGHIYLNGRDISPNQRGYNLVALSASGAVADAANFDTHGDASASARLALWLGSLPAGTVVAGAVRDEASMNLSSDAVNALRSIGLETNLRAHFRWGHAFISAKGSIDWVRTQEGSDAVRPVQLSLGLPLSEPRLAAQVFEIQIVK